MASVAYQEYVIEHVKKVKDYKIYGTEVVEYKLTLDSGEIVGYSRHKAKQAPQVGENIAGIIERNDYGVILKVTKPSNQQIVAITLKTLDSKLDKIIAMLEELPDNI
jgi:hypothetical protein